MSTTFVNVLIVADTRKMVGRPIGTVADYVAVAALSELPAVKFCGEVPSITELFVHDCREKPRSDALTSADKAFLKALYALDPTESTEAAKKHLARQVASEIEAHGATEGSEGH